MTTTTTRKPSRRSARFTRHEASGVHRLEHAHVNCYILEDDSGLTIVDTAHPATWPLVQRAIRALGRRNDDVRAIILTHAHFDHLGFARRAMDEWAVPVLAHPGEFYIAEHPYRYEHERPRFIYPFMHPGSTPVMLTMARAGALKVKGITGLTPIEPNQQLDVPGKPQVIFSPGHTAGHSALFLEAKSVLLTGDALVTLDPYTGVTGPQIVSGAATADSDLALDSLTALEQTEAHTVLPGHGKPWHGGIRNAVALARAAGPS